MAEKVFPKGIFTFKKKETAPEWVLGDMNINIDDFVAWVNESPDYITDYKGSRQVKFNITMSQDGRVVISVNTWKPSGEATAKAESVTSKKQDHNDDLPFVLTAIFTAASVIQYFI